MQHAFKAGRSCDHPCVSNTTQRSGRGPHTKLHCYGMDSALMRITQHKKSKHAAHRHGIDEKLPDEFMGMLKDSLARWPRTHIFVDSNGNGYTPGRFSKWVRRTIARLFGDKSPSVSLLRHSYCTSLDFNILTGAQRDAIAQRCGYSPPGNVLSKTLTPKTY